MIPYLKLGPLDAPKLEIMPSDVNPVVALMIEHYSPLNEDDLDNVWTFVQLDGLFLGEDTESFFLKFETLCQRILVGELVQYDLDRIRTSEFADYLKRGMDDGVIGPGVKAAAQRFLEFLAAHPEHWPYRR
ncbi:hypothetical protein [Asticcacaulis sp. AC402]|uniref:hypothetical protein n=1 Tax=Asticcacaulis sp. AC402 TaxID=1282361 RepID=UPI0003C40D7A|nr:hypothetical protein [Asticcacaulis sp. AC402]ESQ77187.1 hypothetical protein ABAC402_01945 [Asticcacaulis sp. AC402]